MIFAYSEYRTWLSHVKENHEIWRLCDYPMNGAKGVILRHDVDLDVVAAHRLSQIKSDCGVHTASSFWLDVQHTRY